MIWFILFLVYYHSDHQQPCTSSLMLSRWLIYRLIGDNKIVRYFFIWMMVSVDQHLDPMINEMWLFNITREMRLIPYVWSVLGYGFMYDIFWKNTKYRYYWEVFRIYRVTCIEIKCSWKLESWFLSLVRLFSCKGLWIQSYSFVQYTRSKHSSLEQAGIHFYPFCRRVFGVDFWKENTDKLNSQCLAGSDLCTEKMYVDTGYGGHVIGIEKFILGIWSNSESMISSTWR